MGYVQTESGTIWDNPPPAPTHKTKGLSRTEYVNLFTRTEKALFYRFMDNIDGDLSFMPVGQVSLTDPVGNIEDEDYNPNFTYHDAMRVGKEDFKLAPAENGFDMDSDGVTGGLFIMNLLGMLDDETRLSTILKGKPL